VLEVTGIIKINKSKASNKLLDAYTYNKKTYDGIEIVNNYYFNGEDYLLPRNLQKIRKFSVEKFDYKLIKTDKINGEWNEGYGLYDYQKPFVKGILDNFKSDINTLAQAFTRFGKTACAVGTILELKQKTLILVDKTLLVDQFIQDAREYSNLNIGKLERDNLYNILTYDVTVTTFQFLNRNNDVLKQIKDMFGLLIVDELHVSAATTYKRIIQSFPTRYRLGLTATPSRTSDNLTEVLTDLFGDIKVVGKNPNDMSVSWYNYSLPLTYKPSTYNPSASYNKYFSDGQIVASITQLIDKYKDRTIFIATKSKKIQNLFADIGSSLGITTCVFNSEAKNKKAQDSNMEKVNNGDITLFTGLNVLLKGVSIPRLSIVINLMAISSSEDLTQLVGRLKTKFNGKPSPIFINVTPKFHTYKTQKISELLTDMENVDEIKI